MHAMRFAAVGAVFAAALVFPGEARANIWDFIYKLSGPQMQGAGIHCEYDLERAKNNPANVTHGSEADKAPTSVECRVTDYRFTGNMVKRSYRRTWLSLDATQFVSTGKNSEGIDFEAWTVGMLALEPMLEIRSVGGDTFRLHHGLVGLTYDILFGKGFDTFDKVGYKFRPIGMTFKRWNAAYSLRWYPNGFTPDEFGQAPALPPDTNRKSEVVQGISVGYLWK
jgi:hypothetical protein